MNRQINIKLIETPLPAGINAVTKATEHDGYIVITANITHSGVSVTPNIRGTVIYTVFADGEIKNSIKTYEFLIQRYYCDT